MSGPARPEEGHRGTSVSAANRRFACFLIVAAICSLAFALRPSEEYVHYDDEQPKKAASMALVVERRPPAARLRKAPSRAQDPAAVILDQPSEDEPAKRRVCIFVPTVQSATWEGVAIGQFRGYASHVSLFLVKACSGQDCPTEAATSWLDEQGATLTLRVDPPESCLPASGLLGPTGSRCRHLAVKTLNWLNTLVTDDRGWERRCDFAVKVDTDTVLNVAALDERLQCADPDEVLYAGSRLAGAAGIGSFIVGRFYLVSRGALHAVRQSGGGVLPCPGEDDALRMIKQEDASFGWCLSMHGVPPLGDNRFTSLAAAAQLNTPAVAKCFLGAVSDEGLACFYFIHPIKDRASAASLTARMPRGSSGGSGGSSGSSRGATTSLSSSSRGGGGGCPSDASALKVVGLGAPESAPCAAAKELLRGCIKYESLIPEAMERYARYAAIAHDGAALAALSVGRKDQMLRRAKRSAGLYEAGSKERAQFTALVQLLE